MENIKVYDSGVVFRDTDSVFGYCGWPSVAKLPDGTLLAVCSGKRMFHICPFGRVVGFYSKDNGKTWSDPVTLLDTPLDDRDAGLAVWGTKVVLTSFNNTVAFQKRFVAEKSGYWDYTEAEKELILSYLDSISKEEEQQHLGSTVSVSVDGGYTFGAAVKTPVSSPHGPAPLQDGSLLYVGNAFEPNDKGYSGMYCTKSADGIHWDEPQRLTLPEKEIQSGINFHEPHAIQLKSGKILVHFRVQGEGVYTIYQSVSLDNGKTFSIPVPLGIEGGAPAHLIQHSGGAVISTFSRRWPPTGERAIVSYDEGQSWSEDFVVCDYGFDSDMGYPATAELTDGRLITVYYQKAELGDKKNSIMYTIWEILP